MYLPAAGREYATWDDLPAGVTTGLEISFDAGATWHTATIANGAATLLLAGPDVTSNPDGTVVLARGRHHALARLTDNPETVYRRAGTVEVS